MGNPPPPPTLAGTSVPLQSMRSWKEFGRKVGRKFDGGLSRPPTLAGISVPLQSRAKVPLAACDDVVVHGVVVVVVHFRLYH